ncbi:MAG: signal peptidase I [Candidatus Krumholzibacteriia bacterium]
MFQFNCRAHGTFRTGTSIEANTLSSFKEQSMLKLRKIWRELRRYGVLGMVLILGVGFSFRSAIADWNDVPTGSMQPTILIGDRIFVNKIAYDLKVPFSQSRIVTWADPERGDVVTFSSPVDGTRLVKRVVALPGDTLEMRNSRLILNGAELTYAKADEATFVAHLEGAAVGKMFSIENLPGHAHVVAITPAKKSIRNFGPVTVPANQYFMMGDNRDNSADSRYFGFVARGLIAGRVQATVWSLNYDNHYWPRWSRFFADMI